MRLIYELNFHYENEAILSDAAYTLVRPIYGKLGYLFKFYSLSKDLIIIIDNLNFSLVIILYIISFRLVMYKTFFAILK